MFVSLLGSVSYRLSCVDCEKFCLSSVSLVVATHQSIKQSVAYIRAYQEKKLNYGVLFYVSNG